MAVISREEFENRLNVIFDSDYIPDPQDIMKSILGDTQARARIQAIVDAKAAKVNSYLTQYDNAATDEAKAVVIGSVTREQS